MPSPVLFLADDTDLPKDSPSSTEHAALLHRLHTSMQNRPGMLVEMHMPRITRTGSSGNYEILRACWRS
jgi:hypothetical protein